MDTFDCVYQYCNIRREYAAGNAEFSSNPGPFIGVLAVLFYIVQSTWGNGAMRVSKILLAGVVCLTTLEVSFAADLPVKAPQLVSPALSWSGFYAGLNAGYVDPVSSIV